MEFDGVGFDCADQDVEVARTYQRIEDNEVTTFGKGTSGAANRFKHNFMWALSHPPSPANARLSRRERSRRRGDALRDRGIAPGYPARC